MRRQRADRDTHGGAQIDGKIDGMEGRPADQALIVLGYLARQGSVASPLLANIYLHYVFDLWVERWRRREATGDMIVVRYADDGAPRRREEEAVM